MAQIFFHTFISESRVTKCSRAGQDDHCQPNGKETLHNTKYQSSPDSIDVGRPTVDRATSRRLYKLDES